MKKGFTMNLSFKKKIGLFIGAAALSIGGFGIYHAHAEKLTPPASPITYQYKPQPNGTLYPTKAWQYGALNGAQKAKLDAISTKVFSNSNSDLGETRALLIVQNGKIVFEKYNKGFDQDSRLISWSMAKSITSALFGIMAKDGKLTLDTPIADPHWKKDDRRAKITYGQALRMTDGLSWREQNYNDPIHNDAAIMLFGKGREDIVKYVTKRGLKHTPGEVWNYSSGTTNLIAAGISRAIGPRTIIDPFGKHQMRNFMYSRLFVPIGMKSTSAEFDASGNFYASSLIYATAQDYARFGLLFLRGGKWEDKQIIDQGFVDYVRSPTQAQNADHYGAHWWLSPNNGKGLLKKGPYDSFEAHGHEGQVLMVIPSKDLIIIRLGMSTSKNSWDAIGANLQEIVDIF
jgi:CubicO group peptidase (beta-lactamase class C family)